jgi:uncharacterized membrane protein YraQ (UPF0718 family)/copper chaperone CopZ
MANAVLYVADYFKELYAVFMDMAPYFFFGLTVAGILHVIMKKEFIVRHLQKDDFMSVVKAALFGIPLPLCSCGVVPAALSLRRNRASEGATLAFLISTPQTGVDSIIATYGLLGLVFAVFTPFAALAAGIMGGLATLVWRGRLLQEEATATDLFDCNICFAREPHRHSLFGKIKGMVVYAYREFLDDISVRLGFGIAVSALIALVVPDDFFVRYIGNDFESMLLMILVGIPLYVCATASIPIALAMIDKGLSPGAAFVFLTVGPATNMATVTLVASAMGRRVLAIYLAVITGMALVNGTLLNLVFKMTGAPLPAICHVNGGHAHGTPHALLPTLFAAAFAVILAASFYRRILEKLLPFFVRFSKAHPVSGMADYTFVVDGMTCARCQGKVGNALRAVPGVQEVTVDLASRTAKIKSSASMERLVKAVEEAGYKARHKPVA